MRLEEKNQFDIIGNDAALNRALEMAVAIAPTDLTVLVTGENEIDSLAFNAIGVLTGKLKLQTYE